MKNRLVPGAFSIVILLMPASVSLAATYYVPDDHPEIQDAIDAAVDGDLIIVRPGGYRGINFLGKAIEVRSEAGCDQSMIYGSWSDSAVTFETGEGTDSILHGFKISEGHGKPNYCGDTFGGGIYCSGASPCLTGNKIYQNEATVGGGIYCADGAAPIICGNWFESNTAAHGGGIFGERFTNPVIESNVIWKNKADFLGGGVHLCCSSTTIVNNLVCFNTIEKPVQGVVCGAGIFCTGEPGPHVVNCTILGNDAGCAEGGGIGFELCSSAITNCIVRDNKAAVNPELAVFTSSVTYCCINGGWPGEGNIDADPLFLWNYHLSQPPCQLWEHSPCVDAGDPATPLIEGTTRIDGKPDVDVVDIGYHYNALNPAPIFIVPDGYATIQEAVKAAAFQGLHGIVLVRSGTYRETVGLWGGVTLVSEHGPQVTIIDADQGRDGVDLSGSEEFSVILDGFTITNSCAPYHAVTCGSRGKATIRNCIISGNGGEFGGAIYILGVDTRIENTVIAGNDSSRNGGAIYCYRGGAKDITVELINCTIAENSAGYHGGAIYGRCVHLLISNSIFWENDWPNIRTFWLDAYSTATVRHSLIQGGAESFHLEPGCSLDWGEGMIDADPLFIDPVAGDYRIPFDSPCRSAGDGQTPGLPRTDFEGDPRPGLFASPDIGADEFFTHLSLQGPVHPGEEASLVVTGWPHASPVVLFTGSGLLEEPVLTSCGWLFLLPPWEHRVHLETLPDSGVRTISRIVSPFLPEGTKFRLQALVGTELTNPQIAVVR